MNNSFFAIYLFSRNVQYGTYRQNAHRCSTGIDIGTRHQFGTKKKTLAVKTSFLLVLAQSIKKNARKIEENQERIIFVCGWLLEIKRVPKIEEDINIESRQNTIKFKLQ